MLKHSFLGLHTIFGAKKNLNILKANRQQKESQLKKLLVGFFFFEVALFLLDEDGQGIK